ncbi:heparinase II/III domain-containing protein [Ferdinandcohnia quinoae]|uniref:Heparinase II/III family protein n=1 Tax=Fredinandcohnia quinoae TaxID=2918902 RepID=A0AAW5E312_9BACI|nr:heparinase II/III family protein [Fredinandcohnia sp. SECRCQ15]MCH1624477.1 heparinase II/III family protein [Fredinandcohnia sp. SECRCQ15]
MTGISKERIDHMEYNGIVKTIHPHPRILLTKSEIEDTKKRVTQKGDRQVLHFDKMADELYKRADSYATEEKFHVTYPSIEVTLTIDLPLTQLLPIPEPDGYVDFPYWTMYSRAIEERIKILSFAYGMTNNEKYAMKIKEYVIALSHFERWYEFPHRGAEGNLSNAHFILAMAIGYDAIYQYLSNDEKKIVQEAILLNGLHPLEIDFQNFNNHNIIASKQVAMLIGSLAIMDEVDVEAYYTNSYSYLSMYLHNRLTSPEIEGLLYTNVAARHVLMAADILHRSTGIDRLINHQYFETFLPDLFFYMLGTDEKASFANFSDSFYSLDLAYILGMLAYNNRNHVASWYVHEFTPSSPDIMMHMKAVIPPLPPDQYYKQTSKIFPSIGWASFRSGWGSSDHLLAFTASKSAKDHNHFDQNNFILHVAGEWLLTNPGYQDYVEGPKREFTLGTIGHNAMLVNGNGQIHRGRSELTVWHTSDHLDILVGDATKPYDSMISLWKRMVLHIDKTYFVVIDRVKKKSEEDELTFLYHTNSKIKSDSSFKKQGDECTGDQIDIVGEKAMVSLYTVYPPEMTKKVAIYPGAEKYGSYIEIKPKEDSMEQDVITILYPKMKDKKDMKLTYKVVKNGSEWQLEIDRCDQEIIDHIQINENEIKLHSEKYIVKYYFKNPL